MARIFSARHRFGLWRRLWVALAETEAELGLPIRQDQISELRARVDDVDLARAAEFERKLRHDVMAHVHVYREQCPNAGGILHLGATSCFVTDNSELIQIREGLGLLLRKLRVVIRNLRDFALRERARATLGFTHFQPAQFTTVGKRAALWLQDLVDDHDELHEVADRLRFRGVKGTTGTQDSFLKLFDGDHDKVKELDRRVALKMGFERVYALTGQTYSRKQDSRVLAALSSIAQSAGKFSSDLRLLCHLQEVEEPFEKHQIGSSAMAYKRNPMRSERLAGLARWLICLAQNAPLTASTQWFERTLDDSANRRLSLGEGFMTADAILELLINVSSGLVVNDAVIARRALEHLPLIASEEILMAAVRAGADRQVVHERIRELSLAAVQRRKEEGLPLALLDDMRRDATLGPVVRDLGQEFVPERFTGRAAEQVLDYVNDVVNPMLDRLGVDDYADEVKV